MVDLCSLMIAMKVLACKDSQVAPLNSRQIFHRGLIRGACVCTRMDAHNVCISAICQEGSGHLFPLPSCSVPALLFSCNTEGKEREWVLQEQDSLNSGVSAMVKS